MFKMAHQWLFNSYSAMDSGKEELQQWLKGSSEQYAQESPEGFTVLPSREDTYPHLLSSAASSDIEILSNADLTEEVDNMRGYFDQLTFSTPSGWLGRAPASMEGANQLPEPQETPNCDEWLADCQKPEEVKMQLCVPQESSAQEPQAFLTSGDYPEWKLTTFNEGTQEKSGDTPVEDIWMQEPVSRAAEWLAKPKSSTVVDELRDSPILKYFLWLGEEENNNWLSGSSGVSSRVPTLGLYPELEVPGGMVVDDQEAGREEGLDLEQWLSKGSGVRGYEVKGHDRGLYKKLGKKHKGKTWKKLTRCNFQESYPDQGHKVTSLAKEGQYTQDEEDLAAWLSPGSRGSMMSIMPGGGASYDVNNLFQCFIGAFDNIDLHTWYRK